VVKLPPLRTPRSSRHFRELSKRRPGKNGTDPRSLQIFNIDVFRRLRAAPPVPVRLLWWRDDPHPAVRDLLGLLAELYQTGANTGSSRRG
jgi:hypothetical protein